MVGGPGPRIVEGWCRVRHQRTERWTIGICATPKMPTTAAKRARASGSSTMARSRRYATQVSSSTAVEVSRASHVHQTPQVGRPQIDPDTIMSAANSTPTSAAAAAQRSQVGRFVTR